ncbi:hypothetical protein VNO78_12472 [Psophocarpus tetragonolobus]|uniref:Uncharacterized protein n=1 Tax=Psophocarpus tetragonolobus TaxID=3891 RepID=A0AAN9XP03_PSOTE
MPEWEEKSVIGSGDEMHATDMALPDLVVGNSCWDVESMLGGENVTPLVRFLTNTMDMNSSLPGGELGQGLRAIDLLCESCFQNLTDPGMKIITLSIVEIDACSCDVEKVNMDLFNNSVVPGLSLTHIDNLPRDQTVQAPIYWGHFNFDVDENVQRRSRDHDEFRTSDSLPRVPRNVWHNFAQEGTTDAILGGYGRAYSANGNVMWKCDGPIDWVQVQVRRILSSSEAVMIRTHLAILFYKMNTETPGLGANQAQSRYTNLQYGHLVHVASQPSLSSSESGTSPPEASYSSSTDAALPRQETVKY